MKKYKNYIIVVGVLILGIIIGSVFSGGKKQVQSKNKMKMESGMKMQHGMNMDMQHKGTKDAVSSDEIVFTSEAVKLAEIETSKVTKANATKEIYLLGKVKPDERKLYAQVSHIPGRIERLYVNFTGEKVYKGQKIISIYSPKLITAEKELFEAIKSKSVYPQLYVAARNKLKLWKLTDAQINAIEKAGKVQENIDILSDYTGYVMKRNVELGDYVKEGASLFNIADLSDVWVMMEAYEKDLPWLHLNDQVNFTVESFKGENFKGRITYIDPFVNKITRIARVRVEYINKNYKLLPGMFANALIEAKLKTKKNTIVIPKSAVLWTGKRSVVYVKVPHKKITSFKYREVILGADLGNFYSIKKGLKVGEIVATNGVFRIDAAAQLLSKRSMMNPTGEKGSGGGMMHMAGMNMGGKKMKMKMTKSEMKNMIMIDKSKIDAKFKSQLGQVVNQYIKLKDFIFKGDEVDAKIQSKKVNRQLQQVNMLLLLGDSHIEWMKDLTALKKTVNLIKTDYGIKEQRAHFGDLSANLAKVIQKFGFKIPNKKLYLKNCSKNKKTWLSYTKETKNPFYGKTNPNSNCGKINKVLN